ncbi:hypothetical protein E3P77_00270 [Wallemia ichthyophaga]|nr:hypothetical protein E3P77_00270 [Wallemia ichthyophaga]
MTTRRSHKYFVNISHGLQLASNAQFDEMLDMANKEREKENKKLLYAKNIAEIRKRTNNPLIT